MPYSYLGSLIKNWITFECKKLHLDLEDFPQRTTQLKCEETRRFPSSQDIYKYLLKLLYFTSFIPFSIQFIGFYMFYSLYHAYFLFFEFSWSRIISVLFHFYLFHVIGSFSCFLFINIYNYFFLLYLLFIYNK